MNGAVLDHIGIAVGANSRLAEALQLLGLRIAGTEYVEREKVDTDWISLPQEAAHIELLRATDPSSVIAKFLDSHKRDGIHHLCFRVEDILVTSEKLKAAGFPLIYSEPKSGAHHCLVNFLHPKNTGGVLLEISQPGKSA